MAPRPSLTRTWHTNTYAAINPSLRPELSLKGKIVVISGGGAGIGKGLANAFAHAGASTIAILGRRESALQDTKHEIQSQNKNVTIRTYPTDVVDLAAVKEVASEVGQWDILISNAGYLPDIEHLVDSKPDDWWKAFEVNVKGTYNLAHSFLPRRNPHSVFISVSAGSIQVPVMSSNFSSYNASKFAAVKVLESIGSEMPDLHVVSMHPGVVESNMSEKATRGKPGGPPKMDAIELPAHFAVWLCSEEAKFLRGKFVWCN